MRALVPVVALLVALTGCGGEVKEDPGADELPSASTPTDSEKRRDADTPSGSASLTENPEPIQPRAPAARKAFRAWLIASADGAGERACALQTERFTRAQLGRAVDRDLVEPGTSCAALVAVASQYYEVIGIDLASAEVAPRTVLGDRAEFAVVLKGIAAIGYALVRTDSGWQVDEDLTAN